MTMTSAHQSTTTLSQEHGGVGGGGGGGCSGRFGVMRRIERYECCSESFIGSDLVVAHHQHHHNQNQHHHQQMAEEESRTETSLNEEGSSSKDVQDRAGSWLQLGIGGSHEISKLEQEAEDDQTHRRGGLVELDLLPGGGGGRGRTGPLGSLASPIFHHVPEFRAPRPITNSTSLLLQHQGTTATPIFGHPQEMNWPCRPIPIPIPMSIPIHPNTAASSSSSSSSSLIPGYFPFAQPRQLHAGVLDLGGGPSLDFRVIDPPRRPHSGIWFWLQASQIQAREPFLPQISKSYLRIKDGRMTVRLLMKYLVNKLRLDSESQVEITCRGQQLPPFLTLQHVRDNIWNARADAVTLLADSPTTDHVMVLHYGRSA